MEKMYGGKFVLEWADGRRRDVGTVEIGPGKTGAECGIRMKRFRLGWEFIRIGMRIWKRGFMHE